MFIKPSCFGFLLLHLTCLVQCVFLLFLENSRDPMVFLITLESPRVTLSHKPASICYGHCPPLPHLWPADPFSGRGARALTTSLPHSSFPQKVQYLTPPGIKQGVGGKGG